MLFSVLKNVNFKGRIDIINYNGKVYSFGKGERFSQIKLKSKSIEKKILLNPGLYLGEAYVNEELVIQKGSLDDFLNIISSAYDDFLDNNISFRFYEKISNFFKLLQQVNVLKKSKKNVEHHYDLGDDFYKLFLDKDMQYSCAYFYNPNITLDQAQKDKKNHIIKKLNINENMNILDIGCGWGGLALEIAKQTGASVKGITLSKNQLSIAQKRSQDEGLNEKVRFLLQDYRNEEDHYDRIVSIGMFEHVGLNYYPNFFSKTYNLLKDSGVMLLHTIGQRSVPTATSPWIRKYIFPGGYIPSLSEITKITEKFNINITDIEILRLHYAYTLDQWYKNMIKNKQIIIQNFDKHFFRMWEFYLLISKYSFVNMGNIVYQLQISKNINNLPLTRNYMYN